MTQARMEETEAGKPSWTTPRKPIQMLWQPPSGWGAVSILQDPPHHQVLGGPIGILARALCPGPVGRQLWP